MDPAVRSFLSPAAGTHLGLIVEDDRFLVSSVVEWTHTALRANGGVVLVGTTLHLEQIRAECARRSIPLSAAERAGRAVLIDADWMLSHFMLDGSPDSGRFRALLDEILDQLAKVVGSPERVRAWGEMVSLLRERRNARAAQDLEALWGKAIRERGFSLLCSYHTNGVEEGPDADLLRDVARTHVSWMPQPKGIE